MLPLSTTTTCGGSRAAGQPASQPAWQGINEPCEGSPAARCMEHACRSGGGPAPLTHPTGQLPALAPSSPPASGQAHPPTGDSLPVTRMSVFQIMSAEVMMSPAGGQAAGADRRPGQENPAAASLPYDAPTDATGTHVPSRTGASALRPCRHPQSSQAALPRPCQRPAAAAARSAALAACSLRRLTQVHPLHQQLPLVHLGDLLHLRAGGRAGLGLLYIAFPP